MWFARAIKSKDIRICKVAPLVKAPAAKPDDLSSIRTIYLNVETRNQLHHVLSLPPVCTYKMPPSHMPIGLTYIFLFSRVKSGRVMAVHTFIPSPLEVWEDRSL